MESRHSQIVGESISGQRCVDEQTFGSVAILSERLERLKKLDGIFEAVTFSPMVEKLSSQISTIAV